MCTRTDRREEVDDDGSEEGKRQHKKRQTTLDTTLCWSHREVVARATRSEAVLAPMQAGHAHTKRTPRVSVDHNTLPSQGVLTIHCSARADAAIGRTPAPSQRPRSAAEGWIGGPEARPSRRAGVREACQVDRRPCHRLSLPAQVFFRVGLAGKAKLEEVSVEATGRRAFSPRRISLLAFRMPRRTRVRPRQKSAASRACGGNKNDPTTPWWRKLVMRCEQERVIRRAWYYRGIRHTGHKSIRAYGHTGIGMKERPGIGPKERAGPRVRFVLDNPIPSRFPKMYTEIERYFERTIVARI